MKGTVDESLRALLEIAISATKGGPQRALLVWIDTAFNGGLVIPRTQIEALGLKQASTTQAILADGSVVDLETYSAYLIELVWPNDSNTGCCERWTVAAVGNLVARQTAVGCRLCRNVACARLVPASQASKAAS